MPIYEYQCAACQRIFEALQRVSEPPLDACRQCGGPASRLISSPAIQFVGSGWYVTDYARKGKANKDGASDSSKKASAPPKKQSATKSAAAAS